MFLTLLHRGGEIWNVYLAIAPDSAEAGAAHLEFELSGGGDSPMRLVRELPPELMEALQGGRSLTRESLDRELERAVAADPGSSSPE